MSRRWDSFARRLAWAFGSGWPQTARFLGSIIGMVELVTLVLPPHRAPDSGLIGFAAGLILVPNAVSAQERRRKDQRDDEHES